MVSCRPIKSRKSLLRFYVKVFQMVFAFNFFKQRFYVKITNISVMTPRAFWQIDELAAHIPSEFTILIMEAKVPSKCFCPSKSLYRFTSLWEHENSNVLNVFHTQPRVLYSPIIIFVSHSNMHILWERILIWKQSIFYGFIHLQRSWIRWSCFWNAICLSYQPVRICLSLALRHRSLPREYEHPVSKNRESSSWQKKKRKIFSKTVPFW